MIQNLKRKIIFKINSNYYVKKYIETKLYLYKKLRKSTRDSRVQKDSDLAIIGYPRCGNSFGTRVIQYLQPTNIKIASHHHFVAELKYALQLGVPSLLLVRDPLNAVSSLVVRNPEIKISHALRWYIWFYQEAYKCSKKCCVADYKEITKSPDVIIQKLNAMYNLNLYYRVLQDNDIKLLRSEMIKHEENIFSNRLEQTKVIMSVPNYAKQKLKTDIMESIETDYKALLKQANKIYNLFNINQHSFSN